MKAVAIKKKTENSTNHLSNGKNHVNAKFSVASKWDESGRDLAQKGKNQSLNSADNVACQNRQGKDKGQQEVATLLLL